MIITNQAKVYIKKMMEENGESNLRFTFEGAGCCGPNFGVTYSIGKKEIKRILLME